MESARIAALEKENAALKEENTRKAAIIDYEGEIRKAMQTKFLGLSTENRHLGTRLASSEEQKEELQKELRELRARLRPV